MSYNAKIRADAMSLNPIDDALFVKMAESPEVRRERQGFISERIT